MRNHVAYKEHYTDDHYSFSIDTPLYQLCRQGELGAKRENNTVDYKTKHVDPMTYCSLGVYLFIRWWFIMSHNSLGLPEYKELIALALSPFNFQHHSDYISWDKICFPPSTPPTPS